MKPLRSADDERQVISKNLTSLLEKTNKKIIDVSNDLGIPERTVYSWFNGEKYPRIDKIQMLADYFNVLKSDITEVKATNLIHYSKIVNIPVLGEIACGDPLLAEENIQEYREEAEENLPPGELFFLKANGDSMAPTIPDQSYILIRSQPEVEEGEIAAVLVNGDTEATLKRVKHHGNQVILMPDNPNFQPYIVSEENPARVLGKAVKVSFDL